MGGRNPKSSAPLPHAKLVNNGLVCRKTSPRRRPRAEKEVMDRRITQGISQVTLKENIGMKCANFVQMETNLYKGGDYHAIRCKG